MNRSWMILALFLTAPFLISPRAVNAQDRAWNDCARRAAVSAGLSDSDIQITPESDDRGRTYILNWEVRGGGPRRQRGYCEVDRKGRRIVRFETNPYHRDRDRDRDRDYDNTPAYTGPYPHVRVDTDGRGYFSSGSFRIDQLDRGYVDSKEQVAVSLRGRNGARITFFGDVIWSDAGREFTVRITSSDRGGARGQANIRLNGDHNEVEAIALDGRMADGGDFKAEFNRNR